MKLTRDLLAEMGKRYPRIGPTLVIKLSKTSMGINDLIRLKLLAEDGYIKLESPILVMAIIQSRSWERDGNTFIRVRFPLGIACGHPAVTLAKLETIESIKFANENPLNALVTGRKKKQDDAANEIISSCLSSQVMEAAENWGLTVDATLDTAIKELPGIVFTVKNGAEALFETRLDGWSGCIIHKGEVLDVAYGGAQQIQKLLIETIQEEVLSLTD